MYATTIFRKRLLIVSNFYRLCYIDIFYKKNGIIFFSLSAICKTIIKEIATK